MGPILGATHFLVVVFFGIASLGHKCSVHCSDDIAKCTVCSLHYIVQLISRTQCCTASRPVFGCFQTILSPFFIARFVQLSVKLCNVQCTKCIGLQCAPFPDKGVCWCKKVQQLQFVPAWSLLTAKKSDFQTQWNNYICRRSVPMYSLVQRRSKNSNAAKLTVCTHFQIEGASLPKQVEPRGGENLAFNGLRRLRRGWTNVWVGIAAKTSLDCCCNLQNCKKLAKLPFNNHEHFESWICPIFKVICRLTLRTPVNLCKFAMNIFGLEMTLLPLQSFFSPEIYPFWSDRPICCGL